MTTESYSLNYSIFLNNNTEEEKEENKDIWEAKRIFVFTLLCSITVITVFGNTLTLVAFGIDRKLRSSLGNWFIINLSIADLLVGLVSLPLDITAYAYGYWPFGLGGCRFWSTVDYIATIESVCAVLLISLDRYLLVTMEVRHLTLLTRKKVCLQCLASWVVTCAFILLLVLGYPAFSRADYIDFSEECDVEFLYDTTMTVIFVIVTFIVPLLVLLYLNATIYLRIRKRAKSITPDTTTQQLYRAVVNTHVSLALVNVDTEASAETGQNNTENTNNKTSANTNNITSKANGGNSNVNDVNIQTNSNCDQRQKKSRKAAKTLTLLVGMFFICWAPHNLAVVVDQLCTDYCVTYTAWDVVSYVMWVNSALNPVLYGVFHPGFRENFKKLLLCKCVK
ncbi:histamine H3 receptor-like [Glandiceps talaboti]